MANHNNNFLPCISFLVMTAVLLSIFVNTAALATDIPVAQNDIYTTLQDTILSVAEPGVLANDSDADGVLLIAVKVTEPAHGTIKLIADGSFTYTPAIGYSGPDSFTYHAFVDGTGYSNIATVTIRISAPPVAIDDSYNVPQDTTLTVTKPGVLVNDFDVDGDPLTTIKVTDPAHGNITLSEDGVFTYKPATGYTGGDSFTYQVYDGTTYSNIATVTIRISAPPVAIDDSYNVPQDTTLTVPVPGVLANDTDADGDSLTAVKVTEPTHGAITLKADGSFTYTPATGYTGFDSFTYQAYDGLVVSQTTKVSLKTTIAGAGVTDVSASVNENGSFTQKVEAVSGDKQATIIVEPGTIGRYTSGLPLNQITINQIEAIQNPVTAVSIVSFTYESGPADATFIPSVTIKISYDPAKIPAGVKETDLAVAFFDDGTKVWHKLVSIVDPVAHSITAPTEHLSLFAVICELCSPLIPTSPSMAMPTSVLLSGLKIVPNEILVGQDINISLEATNPGETGGLYIVTLSIDGVAIDSKNIYLEAGQKQGLTFLASQVSAGKHVLKINDLASSIDVKPESSAKFSWLILVIAALLIGSVGVFIAIKNIRSRSLKVEAENRLDVEGADANMNGHKEVSTMTRLSRSDHEDNVGTLAPEQNKTIGSGIVRESPDAEGTEVAGQKAKSVVPDRSQPGLTIEYQLVRSNIVNELEHNLIIANAPLREKLIPFNTTSWDNNHLGNSPVLANIQKEFARIYYDINLANTVVALANRFERRNEAVDQSYLKLCSKISDQIKSLVHL